MSIFARKASELEKDVADVEEEIDELVSRDVAEPQQQPVVARHPAIQTTGRLTVAPAGLSPAEHASLYWTHNRMCRFPAS